MYHFQDEPQLAKITRDSAKITVEQVHGLMSQVSKYNLTMLILFPLLVKGSMKLTQKSFIQQCAGYQRHLVQFCTPVQEVSQRLIRSRAHDYIVKLVILWFCLCKLTFCFDPVYEAMHIVPYISSVVSASDKALWVIKCINMTNSITMFLPFDYLELVLAKNMTELYKCYPKNEATMIRRERKEGLKSNLLH